MAFIDTPNTLVKGHVKQGRRLGIVAEISPGKLEFISTLITAGLYSFRSYFVTQ